MNIYVGNISYQTSEDELRQIFGAHGAVTSVAIIRDKFTDQSKGFGFVEMANASEAKAAITELNGSELRGRQITVNEARPREDRGGPGGPPRGGGGGGGGGDRGPRGGGGGGGGGGRGGERGGRW